MPRPTFVWNEQYSFHRFDLAMLLNPQGKDKRLVATADLLAER